MKLTAEPVAIVKPMNFNIGIEEPANMPNVIVVVSAHATTAWRVAFCSTSDSFLLTNRA